MKVPRKITSRKVVKTSFWDLIINGLLLNILLLKEGICCPIHYPELHKMFLINIHWMFKRCIPVSDCRYRGTVRYLPIRQIWDIPKTVAKLTELIWSEWPVVLLPPQDSLPNLHNISQVLLRKGGCWNDCITKKCSDNDLKVLCDKD